MSTIKNYYQYDKRHKTGRWVSRINCGKNCKSSILGFIIFMDTASEPNGSGKVTYGDIRILPNDFERVHFRIEGECDFELGQEFTVDEVGALIDHNSRKYVDSLFRAPIFGY